MKITDVRTILLRYDYKKPIMDALYPLADRQCLLIFVETDAGIVGIGEAAYFGGPGISTQTVIERELKPSLLGEDPIRIEKIWTKLYRQSYHHGRRGLVLTAIGGIDVALWDLLGKTCHQPVYKLCGAYRESIMAYASGCFYQEGKTCRDVAEEAAAYVGQGFRAVKMKVGRNKDVPLNPLEVLTNSAANVSLEEDIERVVAVRAAIGPETLLMVDANNAWTEPTAIHMGKEFEKLGVYWLEEPVMTDDIEGSARIARALAMQVAGYESEQSLYGFRELITRHAVDVVQPDPTWVGGFTEARKIAALAQAYNKPVVPHSFNSAVSILINLHFTCSIPNGQMVEVDRNPNPLRDDLLEEPLRLDARGYLHVPERPGFGIELNQAVLAEYEIRR